LNLPRALATEKAFPENEAVLTLNVAGGTTPLVGYEFLYERRLGSRSQLEISVPLALRNDEATGWQSGLGDVALAVKHVVFHRLDTGTIVSAAGEVILPTGKESQDFGSGVTVFEPFVAVGQLIRSDGFLQLQAGMELSTDRERVGHEFFLRTAVGKTFTAGRFGRSWSPIVELLGAREIGGNEKVEWDLVPQMQVALSRRQHIMISAGVRFPLTDRREREVQVLAYLLWDWFDGGFFDGWR
jgi:hypothetical protein